MASAISDLFHFIHDDSFQLELAFIFTTIIGLISYILAPFDFIYLVINLSLLIFELGNDFLGIAPII